MTTTPSITVAVPRALLERAIHILDSEEYFNCARGLAACIPSDLPAILNPNPKGGETCQTKQQSPACKGASGVPSTTGPDLPAGVTGEENPQPDYRDLWDAFVNGAREARANPTANENDFNRAADGYCKLVHNQKAPEFTALIEDRKLTRVDIGDGVVVVTDGKPMSSEFQARVLANPAGALKRQVEADGFYHIREENGVITLPTLNPSTKS